MDIHPIRCEADYRAAFAEVSRKFDREPEPGTPEGDRFEILLTLIAAYEAAYFPVDLPDPLEAIRFRMEQAGLTPKDLAPLFGCLNRVYKVLSGKRPLTLAMIRKPHDRLGIPAGCLIRAPRTA
jgi:HTH-type transcriptional regulator/antitoxin HigA